MKIKTAILGASGYTGAELLRLLSAHSTFDVQFATGDSQAGKSVSEIYPHLITYKDLKLERFVDIKQSIQGCDLVFCALPHGEAMSILPSVTSGVVVDLGADFRLKDCALYKEWYHRDHVAAAELGRWVYGIPELFRDKIKSAKRIANPGCYATAAILGLAPLYKSDLVERIAVVDAISGTSGAGKSPSAALHYSHAFEDIRTYKVTAHQHTPEIEAAFKLYSGSDVVVSLTPHLAPMVRGIHAVCSAQVKGGVTVEKIKQAFDDCYQGERFIELTTTSPGTKDVRGCNMTRISPNFDSRSQRVIVNVVIDNLVKGASGQAIQNANIALGLDEGLGLSREGLYP